MEAFPLRAVAHDERLTVTEHLTELRARLLLSLAVLPVLFAGCLWQSRPLLRVSQRAARSARDEFGGAGFRDCVAPGAGAQRRCIHPAGAPRLQGDGRRREL